MNSLLAQFQSPDPSALLPLWKRLTAVPGGKLVFNRILGVLVPYTGSIQPQVEALEPGYCKVAVEDRRKVRNHLRCVHAIALANLGEAATGLALLSALPPTMRGIVTSLTTEYRKKARGRLTAEARVEALDEAVEKKISVKGHIRDESGTEVATVTAEWTVGPRK